MFIPCDDYPPQEKRYYLLLCSLFNFFIIIFSLVFNKTNYKDFVLGTCASVTSFMSAFLAIVPNILALQIIHFTFVIEMGLAIFIDNYKMIFVSFLILVIIQMTWCKFGSCMMFREGESWDMEIPQYVSAWMWTIILGYKLLHRF